MANDEDDAKDATDAKDAEPAAAPQPEPARAKVEPNEDEASFLSSAVVIAVALAAAIGFLSLTR